jgi:CPA1 family monovalent cation:H+ antiporter
VHHTDLLLLAVIASVGGLIVLAQFARVPYPILLVVGGLVLGLLPGVPHVRLNPNVVFLGVLPPLVYAAAFFSSLRDLRNNIRPISLLSVGLVLATMAGVAVVAHAAIHGMSWPAAFVLGAIVSPTDAVAATVIAQRLSVPRRIVTIIEGESLVNDSTALVAYRFAVAAVASGTFSLAHAGLRFVINVGAGAAIGLAVGFLVVELRRRIDNPQTELVVSLVTPYLAYLPAEAAGVSGVLAAVTAGVYLGWRSPELISPNTRIRTFAVWETLVFLINSFLFVLIGLQLRPVLDSLSGESTATLIRYAVIVSVTVIVVRIVFVPVLGYVPRLLFRSIRERDPYPPWQWPAVIGWAGMRGAVTLAAALALPFKTDSGAPFPERDLIIFLSFAVLFATLVLQGLSLPLLIRKLGLREDTSEAAEENKARLKAAQAAIARIDELAEEDWVREDTAERLRRAYEYRLNRFRARFDDGDDGGYEERSAQYQRLVREALEAQRRKIIEMRNQGIVNDEVMHRIERDLDLEDNRLEI